MKARYRENSLEAQSLEDHLNNVSQLSGTFARTFGFETEAELAGLLHDMGKGTTSWQKYLTDSVAGKTSVKKDHATAGAQYIQKKINEKINLAEAAIQATVMYHHGLGLPDMISLDGKSDFKERLNKDIPETELDEISKNLPIKIINKIDSFINTEKTSTCGKEVLLNKCAAKDRKQTCFNMGMHLRNLSSYLIDADRTDSAFFDEGKAIDWENYNKTPDWGNLLSKLERTLEGFNNEGKLGELRKNLSERCFEFGKKEKGIYSLSAFTGAGKTLASLRFSLTQAKKYNMSRIFIIAPYTSILDQNAQIIRNILEDDETKGKIVLECHSNISAEKKEELNNANSEYDFATNTWNAPVVITTMVQFLETLYASGTKKIRRMHQISNSIIVFDEIQTLPIKCTYLFNWGLEYLIKCCGCSAMLCTATQPGLNKIGNDTKFHLHIDGEVIENQIEHFNLLKRVSFFDKTDGGTKKHTNQDICSYIQSEMKSCNSFLAVVNTKPQAKELFKSVKESGCSEFVYHLSTNMCPAHRKSIFEDIKKHLERKEKIVCISTRLIEAGVDLSFEGCLRYISGLDSVIQTAGRCNRNNELKDENGNPVCGKCAIFSVEDEKLGSLEELKNGQQSMERVLRDFHMDEEKYQSNLINPELIDLYFKNFYDSFAKDNLQYKIANRHSTILDLLSDNVEGINEYKRINNISKDNFQPLPYNQAFATAWKEFEVIEDLTIGILVPWEKGRDIIGKLSSLEKNNDNYHETYKLLLKDSQQYSVNIYSNKIRSLLNDGVLFEIIQDSGIYAVNEGFYDNNLGLVNEFSSGNISVLNY